MFADHLLGSERQVRVRVLTPRALRITHAARGAAGFPPDPPWLPDILRSPAGLHDSRAAEARPEMRGGCLQLLRPDGSVAFAEACPPDLRRGVRLAFQFAADEWLYGWGEQFGAFARSRGRLRLQAFNTPSILQRHRSYSAVPFFLSRRGYGLLLLNAHASRWHIDPRQRRVSVQARGGAADYIVILGETPKEILTAYTDLSGRPPLLPRWAFGLWGTAYPQEHQDRVVAQARQHRQHEIPLDVIILDYHWEQAFHNFRWRGSLFPDPDRLIAELRDLGVRLGLILTPFVNRENLGLTKRILNWRLRNVPPGEEHADERALPEYEEGRGKGLFSHPRAWWWFGRGGMIDFTNPRAVEWWAKRLAPLLRQGIAFFKNDDGEYLPDTARSALAVPGPEHHNLYGFYYGKATYEALQDIDDRRPLVYARSVWAGSQRYPALFLGDQTPTFHHMRATLRAGLNLGLAGFAYWTADIFGLDGRTTVETHMRYAQWAMFSPIARYFWRPAAIDPSRFPWSHGAEAEANFRRLAELRYRLLPYYGRLAWEAHQTGIPLLRPMMLEFPEDERFAATDDQLMIGDCLLLAPVLDAGVRKRPVLLPHGVWHDFWSAQSWAGGRQVLVPAPLDRVPLQVRGGSILPLGAPASFIPDDHTFRELELHLWPPFNGEQSLQEEDGRTRKYLEGQSASTRIEVETTGEAVGLRIHPAVGAYPGLPMDRVWRVILHRAGAVTQARLDRHPVAAISGAAGDTVEVQVAFRTQDGCSLEISGLRAIESGAA